jgi:hypothetical protein
MAKVGGQMVNSVFGGWTIFFFFSGQKPRGGYNIAYKNKKAHPNNIPKGGNEK